MCKCINIEIGSYGNQIAVPAPAHMRSGLICLDKCIADEVQGLWALGITTTGCCCGHNKLEGYIGVIDADIERMKQMGYTVAINQCRPNDQDSFIPKTNYETN